VELSPSKWLAPQEIYEDSMLIHNGEMMAIILHAFVLSTLDYDTNRIQRSTLIARYFARLLRPIPSAQHRACYVYEQILATFMLISLEIIQQQGLHRGGDNVVIKMDDLTQNIFYQP
jgi:hypothetical protein